MSQDVQLQQPGQEGPDPGAQYSTPPVPDQIPQVGFKLEPPPSKAVKKPRSNGQPVKWLMYTMQAELIDQTHTEVKGDLFCLSVLFPKENIQHQYMLQVLKATSNPDTM